jgi:hypothetical protein
MRARMAFLGLLTLSACAPAPPEPQTCTMPLEGLSASGPLLPKGDAGQPCHATQAQQLACASPGPQPDTRGCTG